jgi:hypothetical protein
LFPHKGPAEPSRKLADVEPDHSIVSRHLELALRKVGSIGPRSLKEYKIVLARREGFHEEAF